MSIVITIEGNHPTDVLAQLKQLAEGLSNQQLPAPAAEETTKENSHLVGEINRDSNNFWKNAVSEENESQEPKKLIGKEHKTEADKMIAAGKVNDEIFPLLSKKQQERVEAALNAQEASAPEDEKPTVDEVATKEMHERAKAPVENKKDVGGLFDDEDEAEDALEINIDDLRALITKKCKDKNGKDIPEMYSAVRAEIKNVVPKDKEPKVSEVPAEKYAELYEAIKSLGA